jgi:malonyl-CoA/methylmalonyl-CoA synthetase
MFLPALLASFEAHADCCALDYGNRRWSYGELAGAGRRCAAWLRAIGTAPGDRVVLFTPNKLPFLIGQLGVLLAGAVPLPLNPRFTRQELHYFLSDSGARLVLAGREQQALVAAASTDLVAPPLVVLDDTALDPPAATWREPAPAAGDPCLMLYSSGTTGWPKGVVHTQANVASSLAALAAVWQMTPDDVVVNTLPLFHIHGLAFATYLTWLTGGCLIVQDAFEPQQVLAALSQATVFMAVPPMYYRLLDEPQLAAAAAAWPRMRLFTCGSAPIRPEVLPQLESLLGRPVINRYGMTEAFVITSLPLAGPWPHGSVGLPLAGVSLRIVGDGGTTKPAGQVGAVQIRGPNLFREYWNRPEATREALASGWFNTGDLGQLDASGFLTLVGRQHDLIIVSGYNVYPQVVERVIGECPGVAECAVLGIPDAQRGECVAAAIVRSDPGLDEPTLAAWCRERLIHYQQPRSVRFVESLPRNSLGKVLRRELRAQFE